MKKITISFVGAGRVGSTMCRELFRKGFIIDTVISTSETKGILLANECKAEWTKKLLIPDSTDIAIVAVPDSRLKKVLSGLTCSPATIVAHTAGSIGLDIYPEEIIKKGVIYPLQTFSYKREINFSELPVFIEASDSETSAILSYIAGALGCRVSYAETEQRRKLHLAAVFACNFTNHMMTIGKELAINSGYSFDDLKPLLRETFLKAFEAGPGNSQTGPAVRNDKNTIRKHLELLSFERDLQKIYRDISKSIFKYHNKK